MGIKVEVNRSQTSMSVQNVLDDIEQECDVLLRGVASDLVAASPVWSGAYVTSHSFVPKGSGNGRMRRSKADRVSMDQAKSEAYSLLMSDIDSFDFIEAGGGVFRNRSPHARGVEDGTAPAKQAYGVYRNTAAKWGG